uniref:Uncharacterized protein n=1 Tax=Ditylenchus dipsaci TaxID=166011 RepID=A0A915CQ75_9BILA
MSSSLCHSPISRSHSNFSSPDQKTGRGCKILHCVDADFSCWPTLTVCWLSESQDASLLRLLSFQKKYKEISGRDLKIDLELVDLDLFEIIETMYPNTFLVIQPDQLQNLGIMMDMKTVKQSVGLGDKEDNKEDEQHRKCVEVKEDHAVITGDDSVMKQENHVKDSEILEELVSCDNSVSIPLPFSPSCPQKDVNVLGEQDTTVEEDMNKIYREITEMMQKEIVDFQPENLIKTEPAVSDEPMQKEDDSKSGEAFIDFQRLRIVPKEPAIVEDDKGVIVGVKFYTLLNGQIQNYAIVSDHKNSVAQTSWALVKPSVIQNRWPSKMSNVQEVVHLLCRLNELFPNGCTPKQFGDFEMHVPKDGNVPKIPFLTNLIDEKMVNFCSNFYRLLISRGGRVTVKETLDRKESMTSAPITEESILALCNRYPLLFLLDCSASGNYMLDSALIRLNSDVPDWKIVLDCRACDVEVLNVTVRNVLSKKFSRSSIESL